MSDLNSYSATGRITFDPKSFGEGDRQVVSFPLAINGRKKDSVTFLDCKAWGKLAALILQYCKKGKPIAVSGRLEQEEWTNKEGKQNKKITLIVENVKFLDAAPGKKQETEDAPF